MLKVIDNHPKTLIFLVCLGIFLANLDVIYINIMEARNFVSAREMLQNGNWLLTTMNDLPRYEKPPLPTWLTALSAMVFGISNVFALRLPAALMAIILVGYFYKMILEIYRHKKIALYASLILPTSFYVIFSGRNGQWDIFTHSFMIISIYFLVKMIKHPKKHWPYALCGGVFFGCSFLSKGPVSLYALWLPFIIAYAWIYKNEIKKSQLFPFLFLLAVGGVIGLSWYAYVRFADPNTFVAIAEEETENWTNYNIRPFYYYWSFFSQSGIWTIPSFIALLYPYLKNKVVNKKAYTFSFIWTITAVILLSIIPEKKSRYLLPVLIPMALNTSFYIHYLISSFKNMNKKEKFPVYFNFGLIGLIGICFPIIGYIFLKDSLNTYYLQYILSAVVLFSIGLMILIYLKKQQLLNVFLLTVGFTLAILCIGFPLAKSLYVNPNFRSINTLHPNLKLYSFGEVAPEMLWQLGHSAPDVFQGKKINYPPENKFGILTTPEYTNKFKRIFENEYQIIQLDFFDINYTASPGQSSYKDRLTCHYFIVEKKRK